MKLSAWRVEGRWFKPSSGLYVSRIKKVSSPLTRKYSVLCGASMTDKQPTRHATDRARISNPVSGW